MKLALTGAHGTGKTTLSRFLGEKTFAGHRVAYCREVPRVIIEQARDDEFFRRTNNSPLRQSLIFLYQLIEEVKQAENVEFLICDRTLVDHLAYSAVLFPAETSTVEYRVMLEAVRAWISEYDAIFKLPIEFPAEDDGVREADAKFQGEIDKKIDELYLSFGIAPLVVRGSVEQRAEQIKQSLSERSTR
jgi:predicted ATPase